VQLGGLTPTARQVMPHDLRMGAYRTVAGRVRVRARSLTTSATSETTGHQIPLSQIRPQWPCAIGEDDSELENEGTKGPILSVLPPSAAGQKEWGNGSGVNCWLAITFTDPDEQAVDLIPTRSDSFEVAQTVLILTRSASEANKLRLPFRVKCLPRWRFGLVKRTKSTARNQVGAFETNLGRSN